MATLLGTIVGLVIVALIVGMAHQIMTADNKETLEEAVVDRAAKISQALAQLDALDSKAKGGRN